MPRPAPSQDILELGRSSCNAFHRAGGARYHGKRSITAKDGRNGLAMLEKKVVTPEQPAWAIPPQLMGLHGRMQIVARAEDTDGFLLNGSA